MSTKNILGQRFGRLLTIEKLGLSNNGDYIWKCLCNCGNYTEVPIGRLNSGSTQSCGCLSIENRKTHGMSGTQTYVSWHKMICRVRYEEYSKDYGDVEVCERWLNSFENFYEDMGERPEGMTLNRVNGAKIYSKETCEWATLSLQSYDQKKKSSNKSGRTGVKWRKERGVWEARITKDKVIYILYYGESFEDACKARAAGELKYYGFTKE